MNRSHDTEARGRGPGLSISPRLETNGARLGAALAAARPGKGTSGKIQRLERSG
jgi:hypothetical protein